MNFFLRVAGVVTISKFKYFVCQVKEGGNEIFKQMKSKCSLTRLRSTKLSKTNTTTNARVNNSSHSKYVQEYKRKQFNKVAAQLNIEKQEDWYRYTGEQILKQTSVPITHLGGSLLEGLRIAYPEFEWNPLYFFKLPKRFWHDPENHRICLDWVAEVLDIQKHEDWYAYTAVELKNLGLQRLFQRYSGNLWKALEAAYPQYQWNAFLFHKVPEHYWEKMGNQRNFLDYIAEQCGIELQHDWYSMTADDIRDVGKNIPLPQYGTPLCTMLSYVYPEFVWKPFLFHNETSSSNRVDKLKVLDWLAEELIETQLDWYNLTREDLESRVPSVSRHFTKSVYKELQAAYPQYDWNPCLFCISDSHDERQVLDSIACDQLELSTHSDWYSMSETEATHIVETFTTAQRLETDQVAALLSTKLSEIYPEFQWNSFLFQFNRNNNQRKLFDWFAEQLGITTQHEWYHVTSHQLSSLASFQFTQHYSDSILRELESVYPEYEWNPHLFYEDLRYHQKKDDSHRSYMDHVAQQLDIITQEDWYQYTDDDIRRLGGSQVLNFHGSLLKTLESVYPEMEWNHLKIKSLETSRKRREYQREYFDRLARLLQVETQDDWFNFSVDDVERVTGDDLIHSQYGSSLVVALKAVYPEYQWDYWQQPTNLRKYFDRMSKTKSIEKQEDWYNLSLKDMDHNTSREILVSNPDIVEQHTFPLLDLLEMAYPEFTWFTLRDVENQRKYLEWLGEQLDIFKLEHWVNFPKTQFIIEGGKNASRLLSTYGSYTRTLKTIFKDHNWPEAFHSSRGQEHVMNLLKSVTGQHQVLMNYKLTSSFELDIFIPALSLAFEYQGEQHYFSEYCKMHDSSKAELCKSRGVTLIQVPYWWSNSPASLISTIKMHRPDIVLQNDKQAQSHSLWKSDQQNSEERVVSQPVQEQHVLHT